MSAALYELLDLAASRFPSRVAVEEPDDRSLQYLELTRLSDRVRDRLSHLGVRPGDRVGIGLHKSADAVAALFGIMKAGAAYVPVDPTAPAARNAYIFQDCAVKVVIVEACMKSGLEKEFAQNDFSPAWIGLDGTGAGAPMSRALDELDAAASAAPVPNAASDPERLA